jgi:hypothetical protein
MPENNITIKRQFLEVPIYEKQFEMDGNCRELTPDDIYCILEDLIAEQLVFKQMY